MAPSIIFPPLPLSPAPQAAGASGGADTPPAPTAVPLSPVPQAASASGGADTPPDPTAVPPLSEGLPLSPVPRTPVRTSPPPLSPVVSETSMLLQVPYLQ